MRCSTSLAPIICTLAAAAPAQIPSPSPEAVESSYPLVITPARLRQSLADVPASVSVITGEMLRQFGIRSVPEALRLVPGMAVTHASGPDYRINYHGTNILSPRRMNVLIDGISVYRPAFSEVIWSQLPVVVEDIDRIEVTRGPNSAAYGPNSMLAVVNIITRHPTDVDRAFAAVTVGSQSATDATARVRALTDGKGVDAAFEVLGLPQTFTQAFDMIRDGGRMVAVGIAPGKTAAPIEITRLVRRELRIIGSYGARTRSDMPEIIRLAAHGIFRPETMVTQRFSLDQADAGYQALARGEIVGRAIVVP